MLPLATSYHQEAIAQELDPKWDNLDKSKCSAEAWWEGGRREEGGREERGREERGREEREEGEKGARRWGWRDNAAVLSLSVLAVTGPIPPPSRPKATFENMMRGT